MRLIIARIAKYYLVDNVSEDEMGGVYGNGKEIEKWRKSVNLRAGRKEILAS